MILWQKDDSNVVTFRASREDYSTHNVRENLSEDSNVLISGRSQELEDLAYFTLGHPHRQL